MLQPKVLSMFGALALALFFGAGSSKADVINFVNQAPPLGCGGRVDTQPGVGCNNSLSLGSGLTATGMGNGLTFKPTSFGEVPDQTGIGEGGSMTGGCIADPTDCEIIPGRSVTITSTSANIDDLVIGSVQSGETFSINNGPAIGLGSALCLAAPAPFDGQSCEVTFAATNSVMVTDVTGNVLVSGVSTTTAIPEPASMMLLGTGLLGLGSLLRHRRKRVN